MKRETLTVRDLIIRPEATLRDAMQRMTENHRGVLFVCDRDAHLVGVLADGEVRRSVLDNALLVSPVSKIMNTDPVSAGSVEEARELARKWAVIAVPVVSDTGRILAVVMEGGGGPSVLTVDDGDADGSRGESLRAIAIVPARGGSKRVERKNLAPVAGRPLLAWAIHAAKEARHVDRVVVSTDDREIADRAQTFGAEIPWLRPAELAQDRSPTLDVLVHALEWARGALTPAPEFGVLLEPTAPLRLAEHVDAALALLAASDADSVVSVSELPHVLNPEELLSVEDGVLRPYVAGRTLDTRRLRGQQEPVYVQNGLVYAFRVERLLEARSLYGRKCLPLVTDWEYFLDVDTEADLQAANTRLMTRRD